MLATAEWRDARGNRNAVRRRRRLRTAAIFSDIRAEVRDF